MFKCVIRATQIIAIIMAGKRICRYLNKTTVQRPQEDPVVPLAHLIDMAPHPVQPQAYVLVYDRARYRLAEAGHVTPWSLRLCHLLKKNSVNI